METEQLEKILQAFKDFEKTDILCTIVISIAMIFGLVIMTYEIYRMQKIKKWRKEYETTLTDEQRKKLKEWRELNK